MRERVKKVYDNGRVNFDMGFISHVIQAFLLLFASLRHSRFQLYLSVLPDLKKKEIWCYEYESGK